MTEQMAADQLRIAFATYVREQARWRRKKAEEYPDDERNARAADALSALADIAEAGEDVGLNEEIERLRAYYVEDIDRFSPGENGSRAISRFGFNRADSPRRLMDDLERALIRDREGEDGDVVIDEEYGGEG